MRIVIELKKDVYPQVILNYLYKHTQMQETFGANMLALVDGKPRILNLREMIYYYLEHQKDVVTRRTRFDLDKAQARAHILEGLLKALDHIDEIVQIIRSSENPNAAKTALIERFQLLRQAGPGHPGHAPGPPHRSGAGEAHGGIPAAGKDHRRAHRASWPTSAC